jgi:hypothetical protein
MPIKLGYLTTLITVFLFSLKDMAMVLKMVMLREATEECLV